MIFVREVPDIGVTACDRDLARPGEIDMAQAADVLGQRWRASFKDVHGHHHSTTAKRNAPYRHKPLR
jgi:hypothetical protein